MAQCVWLKSFLIADSIFSFEMAFKTILLLHLAIKICKQTERYIWLVPNRIYMPMEETEDINVEATKKNEPTMANLSPRKLTCW